MIYNTDLTRQRKSSRNLTGSDNFATESDAGKKNSTLSGTEQFPPSRMQQRAKCSYRKNQRALSPKGDETHQKDWLS